MLRVYPGANDPRHREREKALIRRGIEVGLVLPRSYGSDWNAAPVEPEIRHWRSRMFNAESIPLHLWDPRVVRRAVLEFQPDVIDVHEEPFFPAGGEATLLAGTRPVVMYTAQNLDKKLPAPIRAMQQLLFRRLDGIYACSQGAADLVRARGYRGRVAVIPIGVDDALFDIRPTGRRVGYVGRLVPEKGVLDLLGFGPELLCVGRGPLQQLLEEAGAEVRPATDLGALARAFSEMAVLVAPSLTTPTWQEQFGRMVVEAMAAGVPVVAYRSGSLPEVVGDAGILVEEGDVVALGAAVRGVLANPGEWAERGRRRARAFSWDTVATRLANFYGEVAENAVGSPQAAT